MKIYIAGKISGLDFEVAKLNFARAAHALKSAGHTPLCPTEMFPLNPVWDWAEYMLADLRIIWHHADAILMLDNWQDSRGASLERHAARAADKPVYDRIEDIPTSDPICLCEHPKSDHEMEIHSDEIFPRERCMNYKCICGVFEQL